MNKENKAKHNVEVFINVFEKLQDELSLNSKLQIVGQEGTTCGLNGCNIQFFLCVIVSGFKILRETLLHLANILFVFCTHSNAKLSIGWSQFNNLRKTDSDYGIRFSYCSKKD